MGTNESRLVPYRSPRKGEGSMAQACSHLSLIPGQRGERREFHGRNETWETRWKGRGYLVEM